MSKKRNDFMMSRKLYQIDIGAIIKDGDIKSESPNWSKITVIAVDADEALRKAAKNLQHDKGHDEYIESVVLLYDLENVVE